ncbi:MAG: hypothetical protein ABI276_06845 [Acidimicrobiales bacterium]
MTRRLLLAAALTCALVVGVAAPAGADPAQPTNYRSEVLAISPKAPAISVRVVGGDGFLDLHVEHGHSVIVKGYGTSGYGQTSDTDEPWLRVLADGTVEENQNSPATYLNANRYAQKIVFPSGFDPDTAPKLPPLWNKVASGGSYVWHDHRIHWMGKGEAPPLVPGTNHVKLTDRPDGQWLVPMTVDGQSVVVRGQLVLLPAPSPIPWFAVLVVAAIAVVVIGLLVDPVLVATLAIFVAGAFAFYGGWQERSAVPDKAGGTPITWLIPLFAVAMAIVSAVLRNRPARVIAILAGAASVIGWGLMRFDALWKAVPLSALSAPVAHAIMALAMGLAAGAAIAAVRSGALALADIDDLESEAVPDDELGAARNGAPRESELGPSPADSDLSPPAEPEDLRPGSWRDPDLGQR